ncbi:hypothetical protein Tco_1500015 [Tanacetum coccineum]
MEVLHVYQADKHGKYETTIPYYKKYNCEKQETVALHRQGNPEFVGVRGMDCGSLLGNIALKVKNIDGNSGNGGISSSSYASILNEKISTPKVSAKNALLDSLIVAIPFPNGMVHTIEKIDVEYEWQPPRCGSCKIFDHNHECCPKAVRAPESTKAYDDGMVTNELASSILDSDNEEVEEVFVEKDLYIEPMDEVVDDARKKVEAPPTKTPKKTGICSGRKSPKRNVAFSPEMKVHYFDREDIEEVEYENASITRRVDGLSYGYWQFL